jgi:signal transduction histidine kinase
MPAPVPPPSAGPPDSPRRVRFLRVAARCWLALGIVGAAVWPFYPTEAVFFTILLAGTVLTWGAVSVLLRRGFPRAAAWVFCLATNQLIFGMILLNHAVHVFGDLEAVVTRVSGFAMMGLTIVFAGATIGPGAAVAFAVLNGALLAGAVVFVDARLGPKVSIPFFWAVLAVAVWLYERHVKEAVDALRGAHDALERAVEERTRELRSAKDELEAFSYSVAHDLRAPLRRIEGFAQILDEEADGRLPPAAASALEVIRRQTLQMNQLIGDLLKLSRVGRAELRVADLDVSDLCREIAAELAAREPGRAVEWAIAPGLAARGDAGLVRILLENLLGNAWKFTRKAARPRIEVGVSDGGFFVRDNGAGFDMADAPRLFRPFERLHSDAEYAGSGIGLTIVRRIVERHGGAVRAEGAVDQGAAIFVALGQIDPILLSGGRTKVSD